MKNRNNLINLALDMFKFPTKKSSQSDRNYFSDVYNRYKKYTMIPEHTFIKNLQICSKFKDIEGSIVECGVWKGGMIAAIAELLGNSRKYYLFDSFEGLPEAQEIDGQAAKKWQENKENPMYFNNCKADIFYANEAMKIANTNNYEIIQGWFSHTLPKFELQEQISILRLDCDWYDSTIDCFKYLYPSVTKGGLIIIDDYYQWDGCSRAVHDYLSSHNLSDRIHQLGNNNCYIVKT
jgi:O-methyltransferase